MSFRSYIVLILHSLNEMHLTTIHLAAYPLVELHVKLMRKLKKTVNFDRWEKAAVKFAQSYSDLDGFEIERLGYIKVDLSIKLRLLKVRL